MSARADEIVVVTDEEAYKGPARVFCRPTSIDPLDSARVQASVARRSSNMHSAVTPRCAFTISVSSKASLAFTY